MKKICYYIILGLLLFMGGCSNSKVEINITLELDMVYNYNYDNYISIQGNYLLDDDLSSEKVIEYGIIVITGQNQEFYLNTSGIKKIKATNIFTNNTMTFFNLIEMASAEEKTQVYSCRAYLKYQLENKELIIYSDVSFSSYQTLKENFEKENNGYDQAIATIERADGSISYCDSLFYVWVNMEDGDIITIKDGEYDEVLIIDHNDIKVYGNNKNLFGNGEKKKTILKAGMYISGQNVEINGITFSNDVSIIINSSSQLRYLVIENVTNFQLTTNGSLCQEIIIDNCLFNFNIINDDDFFNISGDLISFRLENCYFKNGVGSLLKLQSDNNINLEIINNVFENCGKIELELTKKSNIHIAYNTFTTSGSCLFLIKQIEADIIVEYNKFKTTNVLYLQVEGSINSENVKNNYYASLDSNVIGVTEKSPITEAQVPTFPNILEDNYLNQAIGILNDLYGNIVIDSNDLDLLVEIDNNPCTIVWSSSHKNIISASGKFNRPYQKTTVILKAIIAYGDYQEEVTFEVIIDGFKTLDEGIASGYLYTGYSNLSDDFFKTLDIVFCAFALTDDNGNMNDTTTIRCLNNIKTYVVDQAHALGVRVIISIGGAGQSGSFSGIAANNQLRVQFASNIVEMINNYNLDGVDIDWETPASSEKANYTLLMAEIHKQVKANNQDHLITTAITGGKWQPPCYDLTNSIQYIDYINVMTYGMVNNSGQYQNALYKSTSGKTLSSCSIDESVDIFNSYGVNNNKLLIGLAFYGMKQTRTYNASNQTYSSWVKSNTYSYTAIKANYLSGIYTEYYDEECQVPYIMNQDKTEFISYDNPRSIIAKCQYVKTKGLAGVMYWQNGQDATGDLIKAIETGLK